MISKRSSKSPILNVRADVEIGASAKYELKKTVTEHVPADVVRAKNSAWLTALSPFTQWAGLIGDKLAHKRNLLRIQHEEAISAILERAAPRLRAIQGPIKPIPLKFLVPFLENASLEEPDSALIEMWATLLVSSAEEYNENNLYYVRLISQMSSVQAKIFENIIGPFGVHSVLVAMEQYFFHGQNFLRDRIFDEFNKSKRTLHTLETSWKKIEKAVNIQGVVIEHIDLGHVVRKRERDEYTSGPPSFSIYDDKQENDYLILRGLGLIEYTDTGDFEINNQWNIKVMGYYISPLGLAFAEACGVGLTSVQTK
jgi:hypothetical protein